MRHPATFAQRTDLNDGARLFDWGVACLVGERGAAPDPIEAHKWFNLAARAGDHRAASSRAELALILSPAEVREAQRRARAVLA